MINNRQNGRRRGRGGGGQRSPNVPNNNPGNRQDNRQRGNAAQLHEKYKALARDAQLAGDRVQTEFYLQFADHYFRVLNEGRARFEEQRRQRDDYAAEDEDEQEEAGAAGNEDRFDRDAQSDDNSGNYRNGSDGRNYRDENRSYHDPRNGGEQPQAADYRNGGEANSEPRYATDPGMEERPERPDRQPRERNRFQPREAQADEGEAADERISLDALPPAIAPAEAEGEAPRAPRRRTRRPRTDDGDTDVAPAA